MTDGFAACPLLEHLPALKEADNDHDKGNDQQDVNQTAHRIYDKSQQP